ncbi:MAG: hypothetical protein GX589_02540 [Deltaproteobacteria bacterium]|nr:hypothetical protein [Deltaproteobacteria bacterium]
MGSFSNRQSVTIFSSLSDASFPVASPSHFSRTVAQALNTLSSEGHAVLDLSFGLSGECLTPQQIAVEFNSSPAKVHQTIETSLRALYAPRLNTDVS